MWLLPSLTLLLSLLLSGCGFRPLLIDDTVSSLPSIYVANIPDRRGMLLRQELMQKLGGVQKTSARYHLFVKYAEAGRTLLVTRENTEGRSEAQATAEITLRDTENQSVVLTSRAEASAAYSIGDQVAFSAYSSQVAEQSIREKLIPHLADDIVVQLRAHLAKSEKA